MTETKMELEKRGDVKLARLINEVANAVLEANGASRAVQGARGTGPHSVSFHYKETESQGEWWMILNRKRDGGISVVEEWWHYDYAGGRDKVSRTKFEAGPDGTVKTFVMSPDWISKLPEEYGKIQKTAEEYAKSYEEALLRGAKRP